MAAIRQAHAARVYRGQEPGQDPRTINAKVLNGLASQPNRGLLPVYCVGYLIE
jgi:hypothetical protein